MTYHFFPCCLSLYVVVSQPAASSPTPVASSSSDDSKGDTPKPKKNRCFMCRKRVGLTGEHGGHEGAPDAPVRIQLVMVVFYWSWVERFLFYHLSCSSSHP